MSSKPIIPFVLFSSPYFRFSFSFVSVCFFYGASGLINHRDKIILRADGRSFFSLNLCCQFVIISCQRFRLRRQRFVFFLLQPRDFGNEKVVVSSEFENFRVCFLFSPILCVFDRFSLKIQIVRFLVEFSDPDAAVLDFPLFNSFLCLEYFFLLLELLDFAVLIRDLPF